MSVLPYGVDLKVDLDLPPQVLLNSGVVPRGRPISDVASTVDSALAVPLDFPPIEQMIVPGDHVTVALAAGVPQAPVLVRSVVHRLIKSGITPENITVLQSPQEKVREGEDSRGELSLAVKDLATLVTHDPKDKKNLAHLGISPYKHPVYLNRTLVEADAVILIAAVQLDSTLGYHGIHASLYPMFADEPVLRRYRSPKAMQPGDQCDPRIRREVEMVSRQLGVRFTVQVVPGMGEQIMHLLAGDIDTVAREGQRLCQATWRFDIPRQASLVVATISGPPSQQNWENVGHALSNAMLAVEENGAVVLCTDLDQPLSPGMRAIVDHGEPQEAVPWIRRTRPIDMLPALALTRLLDQARVYLLSNLDDSLVEELGMAVVSDASEVARLANQHTSCVLLADAHRSSARPIEV